MKRYKTNKSATSRTADAIQQRCQKPALENQSVAIATTTATT
jgi:hypothetical protein